MEYIVLLISAAAFLACLVLRRYFILLVPFFMVPGLFLKKYAALSTEYMFLVNYIEFVLLFTFAVQQKFIPRSNEALYLFVYPLLSISGLVCATGNLYLSIYLTLLLMLSAFLYQFYVKNMDFFLKKNIFDLIIVSMVLSGVLTKLYVGYVITYGGGGGSFLMNSILSRAGGMGASNHIGGMILILLPMVSLLWVELLAYFFLIFTFSRGVYLIMGVLLIFKMISMITGRGNRKKLSESNNNKNKNKSYFGVILFLVIAAVLFVIFTNKVFLYKIVGEFYSRLLGFSVVFENERFDIFREAISMISKNYGLGLGLGGFYWGELMLGVAQRFSNAHNLYLTLLVEGGVLFFSGFMGLVSYFCFCAYKYDKRILLSLGIFLFYGLFSGEIYEVSGTASCYDYYILVFLFAYIKNRELKTKVGKLSAF